MKTNEGCQNPVCDIEFNRYLLLFVFDEACHQGVCQVNKSVGNDQTTDKN